MVTSSDVVVPREQQQRYYAAAAASVVAPRVRVEIANGKQRGAKFIAELSGCSNIREFVSRKLCRNSYLRGKEVKVFLDEYELLGDTSCDVLGHEDRIYVVVCGDDEEELEEEEELEYGYRVFENEERFNELEIFTSSHLGGWVPRSDAGRSINELKNHTSNDLVVRHWGLSTHTPKRIALGSDGKWVVWWLKNKFPIERKHAMTPQLGLTVTKKQTPVRSKEDERLRLTAQVVYARSSDDKVGDNDDGGGDDDSHGLEALSSSSSSSEEGDEREISKVDLAKIKMKIYEVVKGAGRAGLQMSDIMKVIFQRKSGSEREKDVVRNSVYSGIRKGLYVKLGHGRYFYAVKERAQMGTQMHLEESTTTLLRKDQKPEWMCVGGGGLWSCTEKRMPGCTLCQKHATMPKWSKQVQKVTPEEKATETGTAKLSAEGEKDSKDQEVIALKKVEEMQKRMENELRVEREKIEQEKKEQLKERKRLEELLARNAEVELQRKKEREEREAEERRAEEAAAKAQREKGEEQKRKAEEERRAAAEEEARRMELARSEEAARLKAEQEREAEAERARIEEAERARIEEAARLKAEQEREAAAARERAEAERQKQIEEARLEAERKLEEERLQATKKKVEEEEEKRRREEQDEREKQKLMAAESECEKKNDATTRPEVNKETQEVTPTKVRIVLKPGEVACGAPTNKQVRCPHSVFSCPWHINEDSGKGIQAHHSSRHLLTLSDIGPSLKGKWISVLWPDTGEWFDAEILNMNNSTAKLWYPADDLNDKMLGEREDINLDEAVGSDQISWPLVRRKPLTLQAKLVDETSSLDMLRNYISSCGGKLEGNWSVQVKVRQSGQSALTGHVDHYFFSPEGKKYRSKVEVARALNVPKLPKSAKKRKLADNDIVTPPAKKREKTHTQCPSGKEPFSATAAAAADTSWPPPDFFLLQQSLGDENLSGAFLMNDNTNTTTSFDVDEEKPQHQRGDEKSNVNSEHNNASSPVLPLFKNKSGEMMQLTVHQNNGGW